MALLPPYSEKPGENTSEKKSETRTRPLGSNGIDTLNTSSHSSAGAGERANRFTASSSDSQGTNSSDTALSRLAQRTGSGSGYASPRTSSPRGSRSGGGTISGAGSQDTSGANRFGARSSSLDSGAGAGTSHGKSLGNSIGRPASTAMSNSAGSPIGAGTSPNALGGARPMSSTDTGTSRYTDSGSRASGVTGALGAGASRTSSLGSTAPRTGSFSSQRAEDSTSRPAFGRGAGLGTAGTTGTAGRGVGASSAGLSGASATGGLDGTAGSRARPGGFAPATGSVGATGRLTGSGLTSGSLGSAVGGRMTSGAGTASSQASSTPARPSLGASRSSGLAVARDGDGISDEEFAQLQEFIYTQSGIFIADTRKYLVENRLSNRLRELNLKSFNEYYYYLRFDKNKTEELQKLFNVITTNETSFYRNPPQLKVFQEVVVPQELEKIRASGQRKLRIWSAGCSTGEEPYTLAIILKEVLGSQLSQWDIKITANDLSENVLRAAQRGIYSEYALRTTPPEIVERHFNKEGATFHIDPALKRMVSFGSINLSNQTMLKRVERSHIVFCRNVIIYFDEEMKRQVIESFYDNLLPGGCMLIGHSESLHNLSRAFTPEHYPGTIVYRKQE